MSERVGRGDNYSALEYLPPRSPKSVRDNARKTSGPLDRLGSHLVSDREEVLAARQAKLFAGLLKGILIRTELILSPESAKPKVAEGLRGAIEYIVDP